MITINYSNFTLKIPGTILNVFKKYIQNGENSLECGGIITGKVYNDFIEILGCSEPTDLDVSSRYNFNRSYKSAQKFINQKFEKSNGEEIYLGEWHTHPEDNPTPSQTDINSFKKTIRKNRLNSDVHFMIIIGRVLTFIGVYNNRKFVKTIIINNS